jgi:hypothetical protein
MNENTTFELLKSEKALAASDVIVQRHISFGTGSEIMHDLFLLGLQRTGHRRGIKYMIKSIIEVEVKVQNCYTGWLIENKSHCLVSLAAR